MNSNTRKSKVCPISPPGWGPGAKRKALGHAPDIRDKARDIQDDAQNLRDVSDGLLNGAEGMVI